MYKSIQGITYPNKSGGQNFESTRTGNPKHDGMKAIFQDCKTKEETAMPPTSSIARRISEKLYILRKWDQKPDVSSNFSHIVQRNRGILTDY
jgi:hypothetical protein